MMNFIKTNHFHFLAMAGKPRVPSVHPRLPPLHPKPTAHLLHGARVLGAESPLHDPNGRRPHRPRRRHPKGLRQRTPNRHWWQTTPLRWAAISCYLKLWQHEEEGQPPQRLDQQHQQHHGVELGWRAVSLFGGVTQQHIARQPELGQYGGGRREILAGLCRC